VAAPQKRAKLRRAHIVFIDESGMMMAPLVRRTLAPAGQTPVLKQKASHRDRVSLAAAICLSPVRRQVSLYFRTYPKSFVKNVQAAEFLRALLRNLRGNVMVIWDRGNMHRGDPIKALLARFPRLELHSLPSYAPELNPVEHLWNHLKYGRFPNFAPLHVDHLDRTVRKHLHQVRGSPSRLQRILAGSELRFT
jgi:transposase